MKVPHHHSREQVRMADTSNMIKGHHPATTTSDKSRKMLNPGMKRTLLGVNRTFGVPLLELVKRAPHGYKVPYIVKKICSYIEHNGLDCEGIFRVNGSQRVVEKLKASFDQHGDTNLDEDNDIMAVAGLLKMFLRELPESCVPEYLTKSFVTIQEEHQRSSKEIVPQLKALLRELPAEHYDLLKHIVRFLAIVSCNEASNKMSPMALAIVFGPNLFRCGKGFLALKDQGSTNQLVFKFIMEYNSLFKDPSEDTPAVYWERKKNNIVPPRPPPPKFAHEEAEVTIRPTPLPRKSKQKLQDGHQIPEIEEPDHSESSISSKGRYSHSYSSPNFSDEEMAGRISPFHLDSDSGFSLVESPVPSARTSEFVDKAIKATVIGHLFGDESSLLNASIDTTIRDDHSEPTSEMQDEPASSKNNESLAPTGPVVKEMKKLFQSSSMEPMDSIAQSGQQKPRSVAFENKGTIITQLPELSKAHEDHVVEEEGHHSNHEEFERVKRTDTLQSFKRPAGPQNRRSPTRGFFSQNLRNNEEEGMEQQDEVKVTDTATSINGVADVPKSKERKVDNDNNHEMKSRIAFLDIRNDDMANKSPDKSPLLSAKPFVPPLDFSTLHENIGGNAIPAQKAQSGAFHRGVVMMQQDEQDKDPESGNENNAPSPSNDKAKRKAGTSEDDEDLPPFSQAEQDQYKLHSHGSTDDELTAKMKSQMRKIQGLKKKIRQFEEAFENQHGFKPSHSEKAAKPEIKKFMMELSRARKDAKKLKEEAEMGSRSRHGSGTSSTGERADPPDLPPPTQPTMAMTLDTIVKKLREKRKEAHRPEDIELMNHGQVMDEKLAVQKALLHFEGIHGRPKSKDEKDLMRPVYDRYRTIKRILSRQPMSPRGNLELQPVPEDKPMDIHSKFGEHNVFTESFKPATSIRVPAAAMENDDDEDHVAPLGTMEFAVTRDLSILKGRPVAVDDQGPHSPKARRKLEMQENIENRNTTDSNLHELGVPELQDELIRSRNLKKKLRKTLRDFEEGFSKRVGRKVTRDDRIPMQTQYNEYKQIKARLKLLEALLSKHNQHGDF